MIGFLKSIFIMLNLVIIKIETYPVLQASLNMLTESAVMIKASAKARWPICGLQPKRCNINISKISHLCTYIDKYIDKYTHVYKHECIIE